MFADVRFLRQAAAAAGIAAAAIAGTGAGLAQEPQQGGTMVIISAEVPRHLNPAVQSGIATAMPGTQIFASPLRYDDEWNPQPYSAESWEVSDDGLSVTLRLREGMRFHDGEPVTSEDVAFSLMTVKENHPFQTMFAPVESVDTPDEHTVVINLSQRHPAILLAMSPALLPIIPKHIFDDGQPVADHPANSDPVGSGPYKLGEFIQGERIVLDRNDDYFLEGRPYIDRIVIDIIQDPSSRVLAMERGDGQLMPFAANVRDIDRLSKVENLNVTERGYEAIGPINWLAFNTAKAPLDDVRVRQAIAYAIDREFITERLQMGVTQPAYSPIMPGTPFYTDDVERFEVDLDRANELLDEAGHEVGADGNRFTLTVDYIPGSPDLQRNIAEYLRPTLSRIGINVEVRAAPDFPTWAQRVGGHDFDLTMDVVFNWADPVIGVHRTYQSSNIRPGVIWSNTQSYTNERVDELLEQAAVELDQDRRRELYEEFQKIVVEEVPIYFLNVVPYHTFYGETVGNPPTTIWGPMSPMDEVWLKAE